MTAKKCEYWHETKKLEGAAYCLSKTREGELHWLCPHKGDDTKCVDSPDYEDCPYPCTGCEDTVAKDGKCLSENKEAEDDTN